MLLDISTLFSASFELSQVLDIGISKVTEHFKYDAGRIYLEGNDVRFLELAACKGISCEELKKVSIKSSFSGKAFRTGSFIAQHVSELEDRTRADLLKNQGFRFIICVPLVAMDKIIGVMNLATEKIIELRQQDIDLLIVIGNLIAIAASNALFYGELRKSLKEVKERSDIIKFFAYSSYHDLKNPIIGLYGLATCLRKQYHDVLDGRGRDYCDKILKVTKHIEGLVEKTNEYIKAKESPLNLELINMKEVTAFVRDEFSSVLAERQIRWSEPAVAPDMMVEKLSIIRALRNLVDNALKYSGPHLTELKVGYDKNATHHIISFKNDGAGIPEEESAKLFDLYHRNTTSAGIDGSGMGLAIVKAIAERHGGTAWLQAGLEKGVTFYISVSMTPRTYKSNEPSF